MVMKKVKCLILGLCITLCFSGCVSQSEYDALNVQLSELQSEVSEKATKIADLESSVKTLEESNTKISDEKKALEEKIDELENGASRLLSDVNNAFEDKDYEKAIKVANELHKKFNGTEEDIKAQAVAKQAQAEIDRIEAEKKAEEERKVAEAAKSTEDKVHEIIRVYDLKAVNINSVGGVDVDIAWINNSSKTVKYVVFEVVPYNTVNDIVTCSISGDSIARLQVTGPYNTGEGDAKYFTDFSQWYGARWDAVWYNNTIERLEFTKIEIDYMDGTKETLSGDELKYVIY